MLQIQPMMNLSLASQAEECSRGVQGAASWNSLVITNRKRLCENLPGSDKLEGSQDHA